MPCASAPHPKPLDGWRVGPVTVDPATGYPTSWADQPVAESGVTLWRAPTSNDDLDTSGSYETADVVETRGMGLMGPSSASRWRDAGLDRMIARTISVEHLGDRIAIRRRLAAAQATAGVEVYEEWREVDSQAEVSIDVVPFGVFDCTWPRVGWHLLLPGGYTDAQWVGTGPGESYPDSNAGVHLGSFTSAIDDLCFGYVIPQESGHRPGLRRLAISGPELPTLSVTASGPQYPGFTLSRHDAHELTAAGHRAELPDSRGVHLYLDAAQHGLGSRSWSGCRPEHQLWAKAVRIDVRLDEPMSRPTINDVARIAGVSKGTVSRVLRFASAGVERGARGSARSHRRDRLPEQRPRPLACSGSHERDRVDHRGRPRPVVQDPTFTE